MPYTVTSSLKPLSTLTTDVVAVVIIIVSAFIRISSSIDESVYILLPFRAIGILRRQKSWQRETSYWVVAVVLIDVVVGRNPFPVSDLFRCHYRMEEMDFVCAVPLVCIVVDQKAMKTNRYWLTEWRIKNADDFSAALFVYWTKLAIFFSENWEKGIPFW